jgi:hypothetical protein
MQFGLYMGLRFAVAKAKVLPHLKGQEFRVQSTDQEAC